MVFNNKYKEVSKLTIINDKSSCILVPISFSYGSQDQNRVWIGRGPFVELDRFESQGVDTLFLKLRIVEDGGIKIGNYPVILFCYTTSPITRP